MYRPTDHNRPRAGIAMLIVPLAVLVIMAIFAWPAARTEPRDLPLGLVGPEQAIAGMEPALTGHGFDITTWNDEAAARDAISDREIYGALVISPDGTRVLTASAASPAVAQLLQAATAQLAAQNGQPLPIVEDVVPASAGDPRGAVLSASMLPLVLAGIAGAGVLSRLTRPGWAQAGYVLGVSVLNGAVAAWITHSWLDALDGSWWAIAGVFSLMQLAIIATGVGSFALWGVPGLVIATATIMLFGNPWSGVMSAPELMPTWPAAIGQLLPPGATGTLLRSTAFFDGAASGGATSVLLAWIALGLGALAWAAMRHRHPVPAGQLAMR